MQNDANNENSASRLDRIEGLVEVLVNEHLKFEEEHRHLLKAQVVLTDRVDKLAVTLDAYAKRADDRASATDDRLNALIQMMDEWIRSRPH